MLINYIIFTVLNVIIQTIKSIVTIKSSKCIASLINAIAYGLNTYTIVLTNYDIDLIYKIGVVSLANLVGVFIVKDIEEKTRKNRVWKIEVTSRQEVAKLMIKNLQNYNFSWNYHKVNNRYVFNFYSDSKKESISIKNFLSNYEVKFFVTETKDF